MKLERKIEIGLCILLLIIVAVTIKRTFYVSEPDYILKAREKFIAEEYSRARLDEFITREVKEAEMLVALGKNIDAAFAYLRLAGSEEVLLPTFYQQRKIPSPYEFEALRNFEKAAVGESYLNLLKIKYPSWRKEKEGKNREESIDPRSQDNAGY